MRISELKAEASRIKSPHNTTFLGYSLLVIALTSLIPFIVEEVFFSNDSWVSEVDLFTFIYIFIFGSPIFLGENKLYLQLVKGESYSANIIFTHFTSIHSYLKAIGLYFLSAVYTMLWSLLLIVPGIIKGLEYALAPYILNEYPELSPNEAITKSRKMMKGYRWKLFCLYLSFIGWFLLCIPTLGLLYIWLHPYIQTSVALFYQKVKENHAE